MALSSNPEARARSLANLKVGPVQHGGYAESRLASLRKRFAKELAKRFPSADKPEISLLAHHQAQLSVLEDWQEKRGLLSNRQRGTVAPPVELHERIAVAFERQYAGLAEREREGRHFPEPDEIVADAWEALRRGDP